MIPTENGPAGGHSLYCLADIDGDPVNDIIYTGFPAAIQAAVEGSGAKERWTEQVLVVALPIGEHPALPPDSLRDFGQLSAIVLRKVVFLPATGQAIAPTHSAPYQELAIQVKAHSGMLAELKVQLSRGLKESAAAMRLVADWETESQATELEQISRQVMQIDIPF